MIYIRSFLYLVGQVVSAIIICLLAVLFFFLPALARTRIITQWARFNIWSLRVLCGITYRVQGLENIPEEPSIIISNHQSAWETLCFQLIFPVQSYLLKKNLLWIPFFGWGLALNRPIAIDRSKKSRSLDVLVKEGIIRLEEGRWLVIFPEGTRQEPGKPGDFQAGGALLAAKSGSQVVPVAHNAGVFWPKNSFLKYPGVIDVVIGPVVESEGKKARQINQEVQDWILSALSDLSSAHPSMPVKAGIS